MFDIKLQEGPQEDTDAHPTWQLLVNPSSPPSLYGLVGGALVEYGTKVYTAEDGARPVITYTLAALGSNLAYVHFSEPVYGDVGSSVPIGALSLLYSGGAIAVQPVEISGNGAHAAIVTLPVPLTTSDIVLGPVQKISAALNAIWGAAAAPDDPTPPTFLWTNQDNNLPANASRAMLMPLSAPVTAPAHNITDVGLNFITPVFALNQNLQRDPARGGVGMVTTFDGSKWLLPQDILMEARIMVPSLSGAALILYWDVTPPASADFNNLWIPMTATTLWPGAPGGDRAHAPGDAQARSVGPSSTNGALRDYIIHGSDPGVKDGAILQFIMLLNAGGALLPCAFPADPNNPASVRPFEFTYHAMIGQRGEVTVSNNVINPASGQAAYLHYVMAKEGRVTITVFNLGGDIVNILASGTQGVGEYTTAWDGKNRGGRIVARGIYFVRVVGPGFDEIRKVLVVR